jgi:hypothetical protein
LYAIHCLPEAYKILAVTFHKFLIVFLGFLGHFSLHAQEQEEFDIANSSIFYPRIPKLHKVKAAVLLLKYKFPESWLEGAYHVPFLSIRSAAGLSRTLSAQMSVGTVLLSNQFSVGLYWHHRVARKFDFNAGYEVAGVFGQFKQAGFNSTVTGVIHYPGLSWGYRYKDIAFTLRGQLSVVGRVRIRVGESSISDDTNFYNGFNIGLFMEQRLWKNHVFVMGLTNHYTKFSYIAWPAFSSFNRFYNIPEISIGLVL